MAYQPNSPWPYRGGALNGNARDVSYATTVGGEGSYSTFFTDTANPTYVFSITPVVDAAGTVYIQDFHHDSVGGVCNMYAVRSDGSVQWSIANGMYNTTTTSPVIGQNGDVYVSFIQDSNGLTGLYKINADASGSITPQLVFQSTSYTDTIGASPAIGNNQILYVGGDEKLHAIDLTTSSLLWNSTNGIYYSSPAIASDGTVYIANASYPTGTLCAFAPTQPVDLSRNATPLWTSVGLSLQPTSPVIGTDGSIYLLTRDALVALDPCSNPLTDPVSPKWTYPLSLSTTRSTSPAVGQNGCIYVTTHSELVVISPSGDLLASTGALGTFATVPCVGINPSTGDDLVYCGYLPNNNPPFTVVAYIYSDSSLSLVFSQAMGSSNYQPSLDLDQGFALDANGTLYVQGYNNQLDTIQRVPTLPGSPTLNSGTFNAGSGIARIAFRPPLYDGFSPITSYLYSIDGGITYQSTTELNSPLVLYGLTPGQTYTIYMIAVNAYGNSNPSNSFVLQANPPQPCFGKGTDILSYDPRRKKNPWIYRKIEDLNQGDWVKVYKNPPMQIKTIVQGTFRNDPTTWHQCMYKMAKRDGMTNDLCLTGGHALLVDSLTPDQDREQTSRVGTQRQIEDKRVLLASHSPWFEPIADTEEYAYYHIVLDNANDPQRKFGIWANGILVETLPETRKQKTIPPPLQKQHKLSSMHFQ